MKKNITIVIGIVVILLLLWKSCQLNSDKNRLLEQVSAFDLQKQKFEVQTQKDGSTIASQKQMILSQEEAYKLGVLKLEGEIKKAQSQVRQKQVIQIDSVFVPFETTDTIITTKTDTIWAKKFQHKNQWYEFGGNVRENGLQMDSIKIFNESSITIGWKSAGFLRLKKEPVVEIKNTNPYLSLTSMNNVVVKKRKGLFQNPIFWTGVGLVSGFLLK